MAQLLPHQVNTCTGNNVWYACSKGNYYGCCSVSPCDTGICPDDGNDSTKTSPGTTTTTTLVQKTTSSTSSMTTATTTTTSAATTSSASQSTSTLTSSISETQHATVSTTESPSLIPIPNSNSINGAVIGGVIAGGLVLLILLGLILYKTYQSRKKRSRRFTLLRWRSVSSASDETENGSTKPPSRGLNLQTEQRFPNNTQYNPNLSHFPSVARSMAPSYGSGTLISSHSNQTIPPRSYQTYYSTPTSTTRLMAESPSPSQDENTTITTRYHPPPREREQRLPLIRTPIPRRKDIPHELFDTGFYLQRAELAAYAQSELINIPLSQRRRTNWIIEERDWLASTPPLPIMTPEGAVLAPNFEGGDGDDVKHVLSFMDDVPETETELPAYRPEWGRSFRDEKRWLG